MKVTEDPFFTGIVGDPVFGGFFRAVAAIMIYEEEGTDYEPQQYDFEEYSWACGVLKKPRTRVEADF